MMFLIVGCFGYCCGGMMWAHNVSLLMPFNKEFALKHICCQICCPLCAVGALRTDLREKYNIEV